MIEFMKFKSKVITQKIQAGVDDHVFIVIEREGRPTISIDIMNEHGRGCMGVRLNGTVAFNMLVDTAALPPKGKEIHRYCPICGEEICLWSSIGHHCKEEDI